MERNDSEVVVVGGGLAGLSCAVFLGWHGVRCTVLERRPDLLRHPRQRSIETRTCELYRQVRLRERIEANRVDLPGSAEYVAVRAETLASARYLPIEHLGDPADLVASPCAGTPIDQDKLEALLVDRARELGAQVRFGVELREFTERDDAVDLRLRSADGSESGMRARYLVAADGADSQIRQRLGISMAGPGLFFSMLSLMIEADLSPALRGRTVHMAYLNRPRPPTFLMALDRVGAQWVFGTRDDPSRPLPGESHCAELVRAAVGIPGLPMRLQPQIPGTSAVALRFDVGAAVAARFRVGRVFLAGDAAHLMPPTGGFGGAAGVHDAHNLAWKLAAVVRGEAGDRLLDTYQDERHPVSEFTMRQAVARARLRFGLDSGRGDGAAPSGDEIVDLSAVTLGYRYRSAAVPGGQGDPGGSGGSGPVVVTGAPDLGGDPGTRAPHVPLSHPRGASTLDYYGRRFVLLVGPAADAWAAAARRLPVAVDTRRLGRAAGDADAIVRHGIGPDGAVLVRPDGFIAWRSFGPAAHPSAELQAVLNAILSAT